MQTILQPSAAEAQPAPFKTGIPGIVEYWSQGCWRHYGWSWWIRVLDAWFEIRRRRLVFIIR